MTVDLDEVIDAFRRWDVARDGVGDNPFRLACTVDSAASHDEIAHALDAPVAAELADLWSRSRSMRLFIDVDYGQWGLVILSPAESAARTNHERVGGDLRRRGPQTQAYRRHVRRVRGWARRLR